MADEQNCLGDDEEEREESLEVGVEEKSGEVRNKGHYKEKIEIDVPFVKFGSDRESFAKEVREDPSLKAQRELADKGERGYFWEGNLLMQRLTDVVNGTIEVILVPKSRRTAILKQAHDRSGHLGHRKVISIIRRHFIWPLLHRDTRLHCVACTLCQKQNKVGQRRHPMIERPVITQPFETIALDIVGPVPKGKGGARFILTAIMS